MPIILNLNFWSFGLKRRLYHSFIANRFHKIWKLENMLRINWRKMFEPETRGYFEYLFYMVLSEQLISQKMEAKNMLWMNWKEDVLDINKRVFWIPDTWSGVFYIILTSSNNTWEKAWFVGLWSSSKLEHLQQWWHRFKPWHTHFLCWHGVLCG